jgi:hypothetical protein
MKQRFKRTLSLVLALIMALSCMSLPAFATETTVSTQDALNNAVASAEEGDTITIGASGTYTLPGVPQNITIKGNVSGVQFTHTTGGSVASIPNGATFENVTFNFGNVDYHGFQHAGKIVMNGCTLNGKLFSYGDMTFENCTFNAPGTKASGIDGADYAMWDYGEHTVTYSNCHFYGAGKFLHVYRESADKTTVYVNGCDFHSTTTKKAAVNVKATYGSPAKPLTNAVTITNCKTDDNFPTASKNGTTIIFNSLAMLDDIVVGVTSDNTITVNNKQVYPEAAEPDYVAQIKDGAKYETLQDAINAAVTQSQTNNGTVTVTLLDNVTDGTGLALFNTAKGNYPAATSANIVIDFGGHTYTVVEPAVGSSGTQNQALHFESGNTVKLYNGTIKMTSDGEKLGAFNMIMQNYGDLTVENMTIDGRGIAVATYGGNYSAPWGGTTKPQFNFNKTSSGVIRNSTIIATGDMGIDDTSSVTIEDNAVIKVNKVVTKGTDNRYTSANPTITIKNGAKFSCDVLAILATNQELSAKDSDNLYTVQAKGNYVAQIGITGYETLTAAIEAATNDQTIELLEDITLDAYVAVNKTITLDLKGHSITRPTNSGNTALLVTGNLTVKDTVDNSTAAIVASKFPIYVNGGTLTVNSGIVGSENSVYGIFDNGTATINGGAIYGATYGVCTAGDATLTVSGGAIAATGEDSYGIFGQNTSTVNVSGSASISATGWGIAMVGTSTLNVTGGTISSSGYGISTNGNAGEDCTINISGGTINGVVLGVYQPSGALSISGGTITGATGVYFKSTDITISGGTIIGTAEKGDYSYNGNGANATGDALVVDSCNYPNGLGTISISGGTFTSTNGNAVGSYNSKGGKLQTGFITGGTFSDDPMQFEGGNLVKVDYASVKQTGEPATYKVGKVETTSVTAGERNTANDTVSYNMTTTVTDVVSSVKLSSVTNTAVTVAGTKVNQESGITVTDSSTKTNAVGAAALDNVAGTSMNSVVSNAIRSAGENADSVKRIELVVVKGDTDTTIDTSTNKVTKVTYEVHPEAIAYKVENETSTKVGSYKISNDQLAETASFVIKLAVPNDIYAAAYEANYSSPKVKVTHISDDVDYADTEETLVIQGTSGYYYVEVTTSHFSEFSLEPDIQTTETTGNRVYACNLQLQGIIKVQYALNLTETIKSDANSYVVITMPNVGRSETIKVSAAANNAGYKVFGFSVAAQYMDENTYVTLYNGADQKVAFDNSNVADGEYAGSYLYGVYSYLNSNTVKNGSAYLQTLASSMKTYNQYAKYYFHPAEMEKPTFALPSITSQSLNATYAKSIFGSIDGLTMYAANLQLKASTTVQIAYSGDVSGVTFNYTLADGEDVHKSGALTAVKNGNYWVVAVPDIAAQYLDDVLTVTAEKSGETYSVTYSPFNYVSDMLGSSKAGLSETVRAFYGYNQAANEYFANK